ncbi:MAG: hypothetical protein OEM52_10965 [bacterium]|nr:hypothetical protein [bacterium]
MQLRYRTVWRFVGFSWFLLGAGMLVSSLWANVYGDGGYTVLRWLGSYLLLAGGFLFFVYRNNTEIRLRESYLITALTFVTCIFWGGLPLIFHRTSPSPLDGWFEAASAITANGLFVYPNPEVLPHALQFWRLLMQWLGGFGILALGASILPSLGGTGHQLLRVESGSGAFDTISLRSKHAIGWIWLVYLVITIVMFLLLQFLEMPLFEGLCLTLSTVSTGGLPVTADGFAPFRHPLTLEIVTFFMIISSISYLLLLQGVRGDFTAPLRSKVLQSYLLYLLILSVLAMFILEPLQGSYDWNAAKTVVFHVCSAATTTGFQSDTTLSNWPAAAQSLLVLAMAIGGMAGSLAGGIKFHRIVLLLKQIRSTLRRSIHPSAILGMEIDGRFIPQSTVSDVLSFLSLSLFFTLLLLLAITWSGLDWETAISTGVAAISGGGIGLGSAAIGTGCSTFPPTAKAFLILGMIFGRVEFFAFFALLSRTFWRG